MATDDERHTEAPAPEEPPESREGAPSEHRSTRRRALGLLTATLGGIVGTLLAVPALGFLVTPSRRRRDEAWSPVGRVHDFPIGQTLTASYLEPDALPWDGVARFGAVLVRRTGPETFIAFSPYCTHVGCPVRWDEPSGLFLCPCHGGAYYEDGTVASGPPPRPLVRHGVRVVGGIVEIRSRPIRLPA